jgi:GDPmannose 4,6-dehydratase
MKKALIIGVIRADGAYLADSLLNKNYEVYGTSRYVQIASFHNLRKIEIIDNTKLSSSIPLVMRFVVFSNL